MQDYWFWSSSVHPDDSNNAYYFDGYDGNIYNDDRSVSYGSVACGRRGRSARQLEKFGKFVKIVKGDNMENEAQGSCDSINQRAHKVFESRGLSDPAAVERIKRAAAALWQEIDNVNVAPGNSESGRLLGLAKTELESSVMWAVKAVSRT